MNTKLKTLSDSDPNTQRAPTDPMLPRMLSLRARTAMIAATALIVGVLIGAALKSWSTQLRSETPRVPPVVSTVTAAPIVPVTASPPTPVISMTPAPPISALFPPVPTQHPPRAVRPTPAKASGSADPATPVGATDITTNPVPDDVSPPPPPPSRPINRNQTVNPFAKHKP
jgi:hypothetical protein